MAHSMPENSKSTGKEEHLFKVLVIGDLDTGKTDIIKRYVHGFFSRHYRATIGIDFALKVINWDSNTTVRLQLWDIAGHERFGNATRVYYKDAVGAFVVFDVTRLSTFEAVQMWKADLDSKVRLPNGKPIPAVLLANKCHLASESFISNINKLDEYCRDKNFHAWFETSAEENIGIDEAARSLVAKILENSMEHDPLLPESKPVPPSPSLGDRIARIFLPNRHSKEKEKEVSKQLEPDVSKTESPASEKSAPTSSPSQHADNKEPLKDVRQRAFTKISDERALDPHVLRPRPRLKFDKKIGQGAYGAVYAVKVHGKPCIAKRLLDILLGREMEESVGVEYKDAYHQRFVRECVLLSQMKHPNIVEFIGVDQGRDKYDLTLLMERLSTDLHRYLTKNPDIPLTRKVSILHDVSCGLLYMHERSVIHRDLSAANILLSSSFQAKITDLGVSRVLDRTIAVLSTVPGAIAYMAPETLLDEAVYDERLDIFSFGVVALFAAIHKFPEYSHVRVPDSDDKKGEGEIYKRRAWIKQMEAKQPELRSIVLSCLRDHPSQRPSTVHLNILLQELHKHLPSETSTQDR